MLRGPDWHPPWAWVLGRQPPPPRPESPRDPPLAPGTEMLVWCLFAPPQGFRDFRVPVLGKKSLKAHLDLSPEAGPVAEVRSLRQQNPGCDRDFVSARATSSASTSRRMSPKLQQRSWGPSVCVWLCRCPLQSPERYLVPQPRTWPWDLPLSSANATGRRNAPTLLSLDDPRTATSAAQSPRV